MKSKIRLLKTLFFSPTARNTYTVFLGNVLSAFFSFLFTVILVRNLTFADFGYFSALLSLMILTSELSDIGIGQSLSSFLPPLEDRQEKLKSFLKAAFATQIVISLLVSLLIIILSKKLSLILFHSPNFNNLVILTAVGIFCAILVNFINYSLSARYKFLTVSFLTAFGGLLRLILLLIILVITAITLDNSVLTQTLSLAILLLVTLLFINFDFLNYKSKVADVKKLLRFAYLLGIARMFTSIAYRLDVLMLVSIKNATEAGIYSTASRVISIYPLLSGSFLTVIAPKIAVITDLYELKKYLRKIIFATLGLISTILFMIMMARPFMIILFGEKTDPAVPVFRLLLLSMIFFVGSVPAVSVAIYYFKKPFILTVNSVIQLAIVVLGNLIFIPIYGRLGPAISLILAFGLTGVSTTLMIFYYWQKKKII
ncbi:hypothetical protein A3D78_01115 [Candidatus Gottesmanbacteria bacterium RIFCSPHIGHO2_02_FULL_39_14]|uniref:Polysaccharide biosynthesis protein C-terminal domain-containing protein n=1 Tax=Candidatus Gottesmanbacteria bacterium RIFCSPHIGHO2_02_FULL_39_14 TaxID=1798383 RepID=A0A1F6A067_9BACT|nr:MAG: hypothetical protein A3D78_01115 [Candidatus Gottesmanbacteria bacterium RIFCSPHIGHO2_02_FULL_39_14]